MTSSEAFFNKLLEVEATPALFHQETVAARKMIERLVGLAADFDLKLEKFFP
jgi:hypothetical protein